MKTDGFKPGKLMMNLILFILFFSAFPIKAQQTWNIDEGPIMIIITHDLFYDCMKPFEEHKNRRGVKTKLVSLSEIGSNLQAEDIKNYLSSQFDSITVQPQYLLLVGDVDLLPAFYGINNTLNDHTYSSLFSGNNLPNLIVGRYSVNSIPECMVYVNKTINYENNNAPHDSLNWCRGVSIAASNSNLDDIHGQHLISEFTLNGFNPVDDFRATQQNFINFNIYNAVNEGRSWLIYFGLGDATSWYVTGGFTTQTIISFIDNTNKLPAIVSIGCRAADLDYSNGDCLAEQWMNVGTNKGAIAFMGATENTPFFLSDTIGKRALLSYLEGTTRTFGEAMNYGKIKMLESFSGIYSDTVIQECMQQFLMLGDPSLMPWTAIPLIPDYTINAQQNEDSIILDVLLSINQIPVNKSLICISDDSFTIQKVMFTDSTGRASFNLSVSDTAKLYLSISGKNMISQSDSFYLSDYLSIANIVQGKDNIIVFPNPVEDHVTVKCFEPMLLTEITIYDVTGNALIFENNLHNKQTTFNLSDFNKGVYFIKIRDQYNCIHHKIFFKTL